MLMVAFSPQPALTVPDWYNASWAYRKNITIDHNKVNGTQTNFPVLINVTDDDMKTKAQDTVQHDDRDTIYYLHWYCLYKDRYDHRGVA